MTVKVVDFQCEACGSTYSIRYIEEETEYSLDFCPFCSEEVRGEEDKWDDIALFDYTDEDEVDEDEY